MSIEDVKATIRRGDQALAATRITVEKIGGDLAEVTALALATLRGSRHEEAEEARGALKSVRREVELTVRRIAVAKEHAGNYLETLG